MSLIDNVMTTPMRARDRRLALAAVMSLVALVYWPGLTGGFVFDDFPNIVENAALHVSADATWNQWLAAIFSSPASELQRPLAMLSFAINHALTGLDPYWMKLTNLGIHVLNTVLVFAVVRRLIRIADPSPRSDWPALWVAAAWALNPINLMAVLFVVQRMESLSHTFVLAGLWCYIAGRLQLLSSGKGWLLIVGGLAGGTILGALAKESALLLPVYAVMLEWALLRFSSNVSRWDRRLLAMFAAVLVVPAMLAMAWQLPKSLDAASFARRTFSLAERLLTEGRVLVDYLHWTLLPNLGQLSLYHDDYAVSHGWLSPPSTLVSWLLLGALAGSALWLRRRRPLMALGVAWFFTAHLLTATVIPLELMYEHRNYFASLGVCLALGDLVLRAPASQRWRRIGVSSAIALLAMYSGLTALRSSEWSDPMRFSLTEAAKHPQSPRATYDLARNYIMLSDYPSGSPFTDAALASLELAMQVPGATPLPEAAALTLAARTGRPISPAWWDSLRTKLSARTVGPQETGALATLVSCQLQAACVFPDDEMEASFAAALSHGDSAEVMSIHGNYALNVQQSPTRALRLWQAAARLDPGALRYQETLARMLIASGQPEAAAVHIANMRDLGRFGQNDSLADQLELRADAAQRDASSPHPGSNRE